MDIRGTVSPHAFFEWSGTLDDDAMCNLAFTPLHRGEYVYQIAILLTLSIAYAIFADLVFFSSLFAKILKPTPSIALQFTSCDFVSPRILIPTIRQKERFQNSLG